MWNDLPLLRPSPVAEDMRPVSQGLHRFAAWFFEGGMKAMPPQAGLLFQQRPGTSATSVVLYRAPPYQVELIVFGPGTIIPRHRHDHVESLEVMFSGSLELYVDDIPRVMIREPRREGGMSRDVLRFVPIPRDAYHHGRTVGGGCFLSVQRWLGMAPTHVGLEWQDDKDRTFDERNPPWESAQASQQPLP